MNIVLAVLPTEKGKYSVQTDAVLARCTSIISKANYALPPLGLMYIAATLRQHLECHIDLIDCAASGQNDDDFINCLKSIRRDLFIFATGASTFNYDKHILERVKSACGSIQLIAVGAHVTFLAEEVLRESGIDFVVRGEPELTTFELIRALNHSQSHNNISGLAFRQGGTVVINPARPLLEDIDSFPFPARDLTAQYRYEIPFAKTRNFTTMISSRGCPYPCIFCATRIYNGSRCRMRSADNVVDELEEIVKRYGIGDVGFWDDTFTLKKSRVMEICDLIIKRKLNVQWICTSRVDTVDADLLRAMKKAGCYQIQYGVESGDQRVLDGLKKGITVEQAIKTFEETRRCGIETGAFFMLGCPGETVETMQKTIALARALKADYASFNIATPFPGTELYHTQRAKITGHWKDFDAFHVSTAGALPPALIQRYLRKAYRAFYFNAAYFMRRLNPRWGLRRILRDGRVGLRLFLKFVCSSR